MLPQHVLPVFYDVDPSKVRKQSGIYCEAFANHEQRFQQDFEMVSRWREALKQVGSISGWDLHDKPQAGVIKKIVQKIMNILDCKSSFVSKDLVGINSRIEVLQNHLLLDSVDGVCAIGIWGMGGIGKTTLAMDLYGKISHRFGASCFIDDVNKICRSHDGPLDAQKQILFQTLGIEHHQICNHYNATDLIRRRLCRERALLILDNVNQVEQLKKIAVHREWLRAGSRIIIISRDKHILKEYGVDVVYEVPLLNWTESHTLFSQKAFKDEKIIMSNYQNLANEILYYANCLPLAITVLGSFLFGRNVTEWKSALARLRQSPDKDVMDVLQLSFDGLKETEKEIFLDIACFSTFRNENNVKKILNYCGFHADIGLSVLIDKSLISINNSWIEMHSLLEELGRKIVQNSSSKEPRKWSRLWSSKQFYNVRMENMEKQVKAIILDHKEVDVENLSKMSNLRLLIILYGMYVSGSPSCLSNKLRYVEWYEYPSKYLPSSFHPNELVELILEKSNITQLWKNKKYLPNLRTLDLSHSIELEKITDFGEFPNLEWLNLEGCTNLVELDPSIGLLRNLVYLNLDGCYNLVNIPNTIVGLSSLEYLYMGGCSKAFNNSRHLMKCISSEKKQQHGIRESASYDFPGLKWIILAHDSSFSAPTTHTYVLPSLRRFCYLSQVPDSIECLHSLKRLYLQGNNFVRLPSLRKLSKLEYLNLEHCRLLESLPQLPFPTTIEWDRDRILGLVIFNCPKLCERERYSSMTLSWMIQFIQANPQSSPQIVIPGSEIPSWINNQRMGGSIPIDFSPAMQDNNNNIIGFVCCAVLTIAPYPNWFSGSIRLFFQPSGRNEILPIIDNPLTLDRDLLTTKSSHLWIIYFPRQFFRDIEEIEFYIYEGGKFTGGEGLGMKVKSCGYGWLCKQDLHEVNLMMNHEKSLASKCKILAIEDETQAQPKP